MRATALITAVALALVPAGALAQTSDARAASPSPHVASILRYVPDDAHLVVLVPSLDGLVQGIAGFGKAIGVEDMADVDLHDILEEALGEAVDGLAGAGAFALVMSADYEEPLLIASLAKSDVWARDTKPSSLRDNVQLFEFGESRYVAAMIGDVAVFAREKDDLPRALDAKGTFRKRFMAAAGSSLSDRQVVLYVDVAAWKEFIEAQMNVAAQAMSMGMAAAGENAEAAVQVWNWVLTRFRSMLSQGEAFVVGLRVDGRGVFVNAEATFKPGGSVARYLAGARKPKSDMFRGLTVPSGPVVLAFEWESPPGAEDWNMELVRMMFDLPGVREKIDAKQIDLMLEKSAAVNRRVHGVSAAMTIGEADGSGLSYWGLYLTEQGADVQRDLGAMWDACPDFLSAWGAMPAEMKRGEVETVGGVESETFVLDFGGADAPMDPVLLELYGENPTVYMAPHAEGLAYALGTKAIARERMRQMLAGKAAPLSQDKRVSAIMKVFSPNPQACVLVDLPKLAAGVLSFARKLGLPMPELSFGKQETSLTGATLYLDARAIRGEVYVPAEPLKVLIREMERMKAGPEDESF